MAGLKKYFSRELQIEKLFLEHEDVSDFYLCSFSRSRSTLPLLCVRAFTLLMCITITLYSLIAESILTSVASWFIFMTHWGLILITVTSGLAFMVSYKAHLEGLDSMYGLPWYVKAYWVAYSITTTIAFFISIFYWTLLNGMRYEAATGQEYAPNAVMDILVHGMNSLLMLVLLLTSRFPFNFLHVFLPVIISVIYATFTVLYYAFGGKGLTGEGWIYPMLNWSKPASTSLVVVIALIGILLLHAIVVVITAARDTITKRVGLTVHRNGEERASEAERRHGQMRSGEPEFAKLKVRDKSVEVGWGPKPKPSFHYIYKMVKSDPKGRETFSLFRMLR